MPLDYFDGAEHPRVDLAPVGKEARLLEPHLKSRGPLRSQHLRLLVQIVETDDVRSAVMIVERGLTLLDGVRQHAPLHDVVALHLQVAGYELIILDEDLVRRYVFCSSRGAHHALHNLLLQLKQAAELLKGFLLLSQELLDALGAHVAAADSSNPRGSACAGTAVPKELGVVVDDVLLVDLAKGGVIGRGNAALPLLNLASLGAEARMAHPGCRGPQVRGGLAALIALAVLLLGLAGFEVGLDQRCGPLGCQVLSLKLVLEVRTPQEHKPALLQAPLALGFIARGRCTDYAFQHLLLLCVLRVHRHLMQANTCLPLDLVEEG